MFWKKYKKHNNDLISKSSDNIPKRERLFFHDMINQTHGLLLFLKQRKATNKMISCDEIKLLEEEIHTMQSLIKDHFHLKHKNLIHTYDWVDFKTCEIALKSLVQNYLPSESVTLTIDEALYSQPDLNIYFPAYYRIMNNLIKNMAEAKSNIIFIGLNFLNGSLLIETRNKSKGILELQKISDQLSQIILDENCHTSSHGLGLEAIHYLAEECGGQFNFEILNEFWINRIILPINSDLELNKQQIKAA